MLNKSSKKERAKSVLTSVSDVNLDHVSQRQQLKCTFKEEEKFMLESYILDLEKNLAINKTIISDLVTENQKGLSKSVIAGLNNENANLQRQLKDTIKQRDSFQGRLLITEQMLEEQRAKEAIYESEAKDKLQNLLDQLDTKECLLQAYDQKLRTAATILHKYAALDGEIKKFIEFFNTQPAKEKRITNLFDENMVLSTEIRKAKSKMAELEQRLTEIVRHGVSNKSFQGWKHIEPMKLLVKKSQPAQSLKANYLKTEVQNLARENEMLKSHLVCLTEEVILLKEKLQESFDKNKELVALLFEARKELSIQKQSTVNKTEESFHGNNKEETKFTEESFGAISSVRIEALHELLDTE